MTCINKVTMRYLLISATAALNLGCSSPTMINLSGHVLDATGKPLAGVTVTTKTNSTITAASGAWQLIGLPNDTLQLRKVGFHTQVIPAGNSEVRLTATPGPIRVVWDERWLPQPTAGLKAYLSSKGLAIITIAHGALPPAEVVVLLSPAFFTAEAAQQLLAMSRSGSTLIIAGEWGGYPGVDREALNLLSQPAGITFEGSLIRNLTTTGVSEWLSPLFIDPAISPANGARFFSAGYLTIVPPAKPFAISGERSYRVASSSWSKGSQVLAAYSPLGAGKIIALSDTSCFSDETVRSQKSPRWQSSDNANLMLELIRF
ncbi:MAG: carboxypeptidase regulatory-like domain-containing protein [Cyanobacteria bacterium NC_groundwater_1444_Ag_S-0.65um_54_12]|nr:carboxypeptidase regulatory-like domain-containing protein [Cyanobacteria bacterium NC_groundwater_1444_Ag_S-0.65um_54_12]